MHCVYCKSQRVVKNGKDKAAGETIQRYRCNDCGKRFNERSGTPMARLRTPADIVSQAMDARNEGLGLRATGRILGKSGSSIVNWEKRLADEPYESGERDEPDQPEEPSRSPI
jgi:transposase-like protein